MFVFLLFTAFYMALPYVDPGPPTIVLFLAMAAAFAGRVRSALRLGRPAAVEGTLAVCFAACAVGLLGLQGTDSKDALGDLLIAYVPFVVNFGLLVMSVGLPLVGLPPFVVAYAVARGVRPEVRGRPGFSRVMLEMSAVWSVLFAVAAVAAFVMPDSRWQGAWSFGSLAAGMLFNRVYPRLRKAAR